MAKIQVLSEHLTNMIAAGEVVERPAGIVKECVENSIDAGAKVIDIEAFQGGIERLVITDDGSGMDPQDAHMAFMRTFSEINPHSPPPLQVVEVPSVQDSASVNRLADELESHRANLIFLDAGSMTPQLIELLAHEEVLLVAFQIPRDDNPLWSNVDLVLEWNYASAFDSFFSSLPENRENEIFFDESISIGEDLRFILEYIRKCNITEIYLINRPLYHYMRDQKGALMYRVGYEGVEEPLKNLRELYRILGKTDEEIEQILIAERQRQLEVYAYLIFHNYGMKRSEKKRLILALDEKQGKTLYKKNRCVFLKERILILRDCLLKLERKDEKRKS